MIWALERLFVPNPRPLRSYKAVQLQDRSPVRSVLRGAPLVQHDFSGSALCVVPLRLCLRNCLPQTASLCVEAAAPSVAAAATSRHGAPLSP